MSAEFPDVATIATALSLAVRAPSMHNSQPWHWRVGRRTLRLYADRRRHRPNTVSDERELLMNCGVSLNHCAVGLAALGWQAKVHRFPDSGDLDHVADLELHPSPAAEADVTLAAAIPRRRTDWRRYGAWSVSRGDLALMGARAARAGVTMRRVETHSDLADVVARAASRHVAGTVHSRAAGSTLVLEEDRSGVDNAVIVALGTTCDDAMAHLRAGEATSVVLLTATALGLATCPVYEPLAVDATREAARESIFDSDGFPQMLVRIGWAPVNADPLPSTPRRALSDVVEWFTDEEGAP